MYAINYQNPVTNTISNTQQNILSGVLNMQMSTVGVDGGAFEAPKETLKWMMSVQGTQISDDLQTSLNKALTANTNEAKIAST